MFVPAEAFLSAALETQPELLDYAASRQVILATPTTLIALLRTVAHGWSHEALADRAREIHQLGRELHSRLVTMGGHLDQVGRSLNAAVGHYNQAAGSDARPVSARRFNARRHRRRAARPARSTPAPARSTRPAAQHRPARLRRPRRRGQRRGPVSQSSTAWPEGASRAPRGGARHHRGAALVAPTCPRRSASLFFDLSFVALSSPGVRRTP
jgi:hypothetical protein